MKSSYIIRQNSLKNMNSTSQHLDSSPYLKPIHPKPPIKISQNPLIIHRRMRTVTEPPSCPFKVLIEPDSSTSPGCPNSKSYENFDKLLPQESSFESLSTACPLSSSEFFSQKLEERLATVALNDYQGRFDSYSAIFDMLVSADSQFSGILEKLYQGIVKNLKQVYKQKVKKLENEREKQKISIESLKNDKESLIAKLNQLSSQNIDLMNKKEKIVEKCQGLEEAIKYLNEIKGTRIELIDELCKKSGKIRELTVKLEEMLANEKKMMKIVEKLKDHGVNFEKLYNEMPIFREKCEKKLKKTVPALKIDSLKSVNLNINEISFE